MYVTEISLKGDDYRCWTGFGSLKGCMAEAVLLKRFCRYERFVNVEDGYESDNVRIRVFQKSDADKNPEKTWSVPEFRAHFKNARDSKKKPRTPGSGDTATRSRRNREEFFFGKSCVNCGSVENLELDHIDPKTKIDHKIWSFSKQRRDAEIEKCQVLCRKCHLKKTMLEKYGVLEKHGSERYKNGCRCEVCVAAKKVIQTKTIATRKSKVQSLTAQLQAANERIKKLQLVANLAPKGCICHVEAAGGRHSAWCRDYTEARAELEKEPT